MCHSHITRLGKHPTSPFIPVAPATPFQCRKILVTLFPFPTKLRHLPSDKESIYCPFASVRDLQIRTRTDKRSVPLTQAFTDCTGLPQPSKHNLHRMHSAFSFISLQQRLLYLLLSSRVFSLQANTKCSSCF